MVGDGAKQRMGWELGAREAGAEGYAVRGMGTKNGTWPELSGQGLASGF